jgi:hypothetical protein
MAAGPVQGYVREVARQGQAILGVRFFRRFLCAFKEIGSGASLRLSEAAPPQIAHETDHPNPKSNILPSNIVDY